MRTVPLPDLSDSGDGATQTPYAADTVVSIILLC